MFATEYVENFAEFYAEAKHHFKDHYESCEEARLGKQNLSIDISLFQHLIDLGTMNIFILKDDDIIVGYITVNIAPSPLFSEPQVSIDFLYILPEFREHNYATIAIQEIEKELKSKKLYDINLMLPEKDYAEPFAKSLGYVKTSGVHTKYLGD